MRYKSNKISGLEYYRCKRKMTKRELAKRVGTTSDMIDLWADRDKLLYANIGYVKNACQVLAVTLDQLVEEHDVTELEAGDRYQHKSKAVNPNNCVSNYRLAKGLSYRQLADLLGSSHQWAQKLCASAKPSKGSVRLLAACEGTSEDEFCRRYARCEV